MQYTNDQGVSEAIGFILIFSMVIIGIGLVTLYGYPVLTQQQTQADVRNMEQTLIVLQNDVKSLCYKNVPYKETSLKASGGPLTLYNKSLTQQSFGIYYDNFTWPLTNGTMDAVREDFHPGMLKYDADSSDAVIALENGGVMIRQELQAGSSMKAEPRWFFDSTTKTLVVYLIGLDSDALLSQTGIGVIKLEHNISGDRFYEYSIPGGSAPPGTTVYVNYTADPDISFETAWTNYMTNSVGMTHGPYTVLGRQYSYKLDGVEKLVVKEYDIKVLSL
jgi:hypothetical protein